MLVKKTPNKYDQEMAQLKINECRQEEEVHVREHQQCFFSFDLPPLSSMSRHLNINHYIMYMDQTILARRDDTSSRSLAFRLLHYG